MIMFETDHHVTVDGLAKVFRTYEKAESATAARARGREKLRLVDLFAGKDFRYECGFTVKKPGVQEEREPIAVITK